ncbi:MAG: DNA-directed RNA polymerase subunit beta' [bacterium]
MNSTTVREDGLTGRKAEAFDSVSVSLASPEMIRSWSHGEIKNPETINYRTFKPERGGLFCERIFGPTRDWECGCGKYKRIKHKGVICDRCGVEVTVSRVRRERMGHIELAVPIGHIWFFKCTPSRLGLVLDMTARQLERVLYYEDYVVVDAGKTALQEKQFLDEMSYREAQDKYGDEFVAKMGAEGIRDLLKKVNLDDLMGELETEMETVRSKQTRKKIAKRMQVVEGLRKNNTRPEWMVLEVLPVIPPDLRPLVPLEGGRFATSDLNDLYRRVINRNNRLKNLLQLKTPDVIIRNEKRMLQEAVDAVFDNGRHGRAVTGAGGRPLKSLSDMLKGKGGRFRQNLLGKRVDYSGRSVIVVGPELKLHQCGLPKKMALVLFEPFIIRRLKERGIVHTVRSAKKVIERETDEIWDILEEVAKSKTVMLNRAPTLHRLSIQSFEPVLVEGEAIQVHPLVCKAYNADFDGDQMAVHLPLSVEAEMESRLLMLSSNSIFSPSSGESIVTPTQDIALGLYYLTSPSQDMRHFDFKRARTPEDEKKDPLSLFSDASEVHFAWDDGAVDVHTRIRFRNPDRGTTTIYGNPGPTYLVTTVGRVLFNEIWLPSLGFVNERVDKSFLGKLIMRFYKAAGHDITIELLDKLKELGFESATRAGVSIGMGDMMIPVEKAAIVEQAQKQANTVSEQYRRGIITDGERYNKIVDIWTHATEETSGAMYRAIEQNVGSSEMNPIYMMVESKARGSRQQIRQLAGMRGLMAKPSGEIIERPIISNFREGLSVLEYFISTHGARKGLADTALKTADAGYLTRKLVDVAQDVIIVERDCNTLNGVEVAAVGSGDDELVSLEARTLGRTLASDLHSPTTGAVILQAGQEIDEAACDLIRNEGVENIRIRSVLTCEAKQGLCARCYGRDLSSGREVEVGTAVGIIAAQSIGEPGTQLTMRTFHIGGTASSVFKQPHIVAKNAGKVVYHDLRIVKNKEGLCVVLNKNGAVSIEDDSGSELERHKTFMGAVIAVKNGEKVKKGQSFVQWDPYSVPILSEVDGVVSFQNFVENVSIKREVDEATGLKGIVVLEHKEDLHPQIVIRIPSDKSVGATYNIPARAHIVVKEGEQISAGQVLAKTPRKESKTKDITGGLPRVAELFEARRPKDAAEIAKIDGLVEFGANQRGRRCLVIRDPVTSAQEEHLIPMGKHIVVYSGDAVQKGQQLTEGPVVPQEILDVCGPHELQEYLVNEVQEVYRLQGVEINDKHIEIIVRQMLRKVRITDPGDTDFLWGDEVEKYRFIAVNEAAKVEGKRPAEACSCLLGITKASLETESWISAASFQDTTRVLTNAATLGRADYLRGFKENVIMGHLIPGGTGFHMYRNIRLVPLAEPIPEEKPVVAQEDGDQPPTLDLQR